jgi:hypothetical protein
MGPMGNYGHAPMYPGMAGHPIRSWGPQSTPGMVGPGMGGPLMQMGYSFLQNTIGNHAGMTMAPAGGSASSYYRAQAQNQAYEQLRREANKYDLKRVAPVFQTISRDMYEASNGTDEANKFGTNMAQKYINVLQSPLGQMFGRGLEDHLAPGGLASSFATRMFSAGMGTRTAPGQYGLSADRVMGITKQLGAAMQGDKGFSRGFNMREFGEMAQGMTSRGVINFQKNNTQLVQQFKETAGALDALKDLIGRPDAPIPELMQTLDSMFGGGGLASIPAARLEMMARQAQSLGSVMGITGQQMQQVFQGASMQAQGLGMRGELGAISAFRAMPIAQVAQSIAENRVRPDDGRIRLGLETPLQRMQSTQTAMLRTANSDFTDRMAAMMRARRVLGGKLSGSAALDRMEGLAKKLETGQELSAADGKWLYGAIRQGGLSREMQNTSLSPQTFYAIMNDRLALDEEKANTDFTSASLTAFRAQSVEKLGNRIQDSEVFQKMLGLDKIKGKGAEGRRAAKSQSVLQEVLKGDGTAGSIREVVRRMAGGNLTDSEVNEAVTQLQSFGRQLDPSIVGARGLEGLVERVGDKAFEQQKLLNINTRAEATFNRAMAESGFGQSRTGVGGMMDNFLRSLANGGGSISEVAAQTMGGIKTEELLNVFSGDKVKGQVARMQELTQLLKKDAKALSESEGDPKAQRAIEKRITARQKELSTIKEMLQDYQAYIDLESGANYKSALVTENRLGAAARSGDESKMITAFESIMGRHEGNAGDMKAAQTLEGSKKAEYLKLANKLGKLGKSGLEADHPDKKKAILEEAAAVQKKMRLMLKDHKESLEDRGAKAVEEARKKRNEDKAKKNTQREQAQQKERAADARETPTPEEISTGGDKLAASGRAAKKAIFDLASRAGTSLMKFVGEVVMSDTDGGEGV